MPVEVYVRDPDRRTIGKLTRWSTVSVLQRRNDVATWLIQHPIDDDLAMLQPGTGIIIKRDGVTVESGFKWTPDERKWLGVERSGMVGGWGDTVILHDTLCWPQPTQPIGDQTAQNFSTAQDLAASTRVRQLFQANTINRLQIPGAALGAPVTLGTEGRSSVLFTNLLEHAQEICARDVNFWVRQRDSDRALALEFAAPRDLRMSAQFSPQVGTVTTLTTTDTGPELTRVILGAGDGENRVFRQRNATQAGLTGSRESDWQNVRKIERFIDAGSLDPADLLFVDEATEQMNAELIGGRRRQSLHIEVEGGLPFMGPVADGGFATGDLVRAYYLPTLDPQFAVDDLVEQVEWTVDAQGGERVKVWVGPVNDVEERDADRERWLRRQLNRLIKSIGSR